ncbi:MAG TPA: CsbD family protein [Asticcacaulis sp.]|nr:CsbD family protein [Asticcacaulis sp.]
MNSDRINGSWEQVKGHVQRAWGKLTDDDLSVIEGDRKLLTGKIQERYGIAKDEADKQIREWNEKADHTTDEMRKW